LALALSEPVAEDMLKHQTIVQCNQSLGWSAYWKSETSEFGIDVIEVGSPRFSDGLESKNTCFVPTAIVAHRLPHSPLKISALFLIGNANSGTCPFEAGENVTIDLDSIASELSQNRPSWTPKEQQQQFHFVCERCKTACDVLGEYASCPACDYRNSLGVFKRHWEVLDSEFRRADAELKDRHDRERTREGLPPRFVSAFEAMADDLRTQLLKLPMTAKRRKELERLSFQRIIEAEERLRNWFGIDIFNGLKQEDREFLNREFNRRHLLIHRAGRVDEEYLHKTGDTSVKLHQSIRIGSEEIPRLSDLLGQCE
jgi:hypothetical protein